MSWTRATTCQEGQGRSLSEISGLLYRSEVRTILRQERCFAALVQPVFGLKPPGDRIIEFYRFVGEKKAREVEADRYREVTALSRTVIAGSDCISIMSSVSPHGAAVRALPFVTVVMHSPLCL